MNRSNNFDDLIDSAAKVFLRRVYEAGNTELTPMVHCPRRAEAMALEDCRQCESCLGISVDASERATFLRCAWGSQGTDDGRPQVEVSETAAVAASVGQAVSDIMATPVEVVNAADPLPSVAARLISHNISAAPVAAASGELVGVISKTDLVRLYYEGDRIAASVTAQPRVNEPELELGMHTEARETTTAGDVMTPLVMSVAEDTPIPRAAALMAYEGIHHVIVLGSDRKPRGIVSSLDVIAWLARRDGYVVPPRAPTS
ncbi:MAG: CBS domain-containing protein [Myxococcales bacterium]|nr:CBS domain-containing protein [Myxococcales bacterium]MDD9967187.1 CBS domain-containing protein [Myxococcales bacterium]